MQDVLPFPTIGFEINSREDVDRALAELGRLDAKQQRAEAALKQAQITLNQNHQERLKMQVDDRELSIAERSKEIKDALSAWCEAHKAELLTGDRKSLVLPNGTIGWRKAKDGLEPAGDTDEKGWLAKLTMVVLPPLLAALKKILVGVGKVHGGQLLKVKLEWDKGKIMDELAAGQIDAKELRKLGWVFVPGKDGFYATPNEVQAGAESAAA